MCLIIYKKQSSEYDHEFITKCVENSSVKNNTGFGFAIKNKEDILVKKGFKTAASMLKSLNWFDRKGLLKDKLIVVHLRNSSPGTASNLKTTHPIISNEDENKQKRILTKNNVVFHNGYISKFRMKVSNSKEDTSDTLLFTDHFLSKENDFTFMQYMKKHFDDEFRDFYDMGWSNKIVVLKAGRPAVVHGNFIQSDSNKGYYFSNDSFKDEFPTKHRSTTNWNQGHREQSFNNPRQSNFGSTHPNVRSTPSTTGINDSAHRNMNVYMSNLWASKANSHQVDIFPDNDVIRSIAFTFFYRTASLQNSYYKKNIITSVNPFACHCNSAFDGDQCGISKGCCKEIEKAQDFTTMAIRQRIYQFVSKREYLDLDFAEETKLGKIVVDTLTAIDDSRKRIDWYWTECESCVSQQVIGFNNKIPCNSCHETKLKLGLFMFIDDKKSQDSRRVIDSILLERDYEIIPAAEEQRVKVNTVVKKLVTYIKNKLLEEVKENEERSTRESSPAVSGE